MSAEDEIKETQCGNWIRLFSELDRVGVPTLEQLSAVAVEDVRFSDPFNDVRGLEAMQRVLEHTCSHVSDVRFSVHDTAWSGATAYVRWSMTGSVRVIGKWNVEGISEVRFADDGRVCCHIDHWDAASQFFGRLPVIGWLLRRLAAPARVS
jgi:steroid delta-isomerase